MPIQDPLPQQIIGFCYRISNALALLKRGLTQMYGIKGDRFTNDLPVQSCSEILRV